MSVVFPPSIADADIFQSVRANECDQPEPGVDLGDGSFAKVWLKERSALVLSKSRPGFDRAAIDEASTLLEEIAEGGYDDLRFLIYDFAHGDRPAPAPAAGFEDLVAANAELIVDTPVITLAWARGLMRGADLDFALHCSALIAQAGATFSLSGEPFSLMGVYAALGRKIGFVKAERLIEADGVVSAEEMREYLVAKDVVATAPGLSPIDAYLAQFGRRYNASHAIFRAERLAQRPISRRLDRDR